MPAWYFSHSRGVPNSHSGCTEAMAAPNREKSSQSVTWLPMQAWK
jgi:hypothetical protein